MRNVSSSKLLGVGSLIAGLVVSGASLGAQQPSWTTVEQTIGRTGVAQAGGVVRFNLPRNDLHVVVEGVQLRPNLVLRSWVSFTRLPDGQAVMGDLVLTDDEINPVISALQQGGVEQTALHNHLVSARPNTMNLHIGGRGREQDLATTVRRALELTKTPLDTSSGPGSAATFDVDTVALARALGYSGRVNGGVYQVSVPRLEHVMEHGHEIPSVMGLGTVINFQSTGGGKAAIAGDFVMTEAEVNPVIRALREHGIGITALHSHMIGESPHLYFMHFWANADAIKLAQGLRAALVLMNSPKPTSGD